MKLLEGKWKILNESNIAELWIGMLKFYAYEFDERVVAINQKAILFRRDKGWFGNLHRYGVIGMYNGFFILSELITFFYVFKEYLIK